MPIATMLGWIIVLSAIWYFIFTFSPQTPIEMAIFTVAIIINTFFSLLYLIIATLDFYFWWKKK